MEKHTIRSGKKPKDISFYDTHMYDEFWIGRDYEHLSEVAAIKRLIGKKVYHKILDYGGGYGRLASVLSQYSDQVILADPSQHLLDLSKQKNKNLQTILLTENAKIPLPTNSVDLVVMVRVSHHLADPSDNFQEIHRVLKPQGQAIIEVANSAHMMNKLKYLTHFKTVPKQSIKIGAVSNGLVEDTPFLNHHIKTIEQMLQSSNFKIIDKLSVSNLRSQTLKKYIKLDRMVDIETFLQAKLARFNYGPSIFLLVEKVNS